jgi:hypothetical protein
MGDVWKHINIMGSWLPSIESGIEFWSREFMIVREIMRDGKECEFHVQFWTILYESLTELENMYE